MIGGIDARRAKRAFHNRRAEPVEEAVAASKAVEEAFVAQIAAGHDGLRAISSDRGAEAVTDLGERSVPGDWLEFATPLRARAAEGMEDPVRAVNPILVVLDLDAKTAASERVVWISTDTYYSSVSYRRQHCTGIGTIVGAGAQKTMLIHNNLAVAARRLD